MDGSHPDSNAPFVYTRISAAAPVPRRTLCATDCESESVVPCRLSLIVGTTLSRRHRCSSPGGGPEIRDQAGSAALLQALDNIEIRQPPRERVDAGRAFR